MTFGYPLNRLYEEVAYIAYHLNWSYNEIMNIEHHERQKWCQEISKINGKVSEEINQG
jgi:hypothetical protein